MAASKALLQAIAVAAELTGTQLSVGAASVMAQDLGGYPEQQVLGALDRCRKELRGRMTVADVITRLDDGRPGPEEAWAMLPRDEATSVVWNDEIAQAWGVVRHMIEEGETVAARMAFLESYRAIVQRARDSGTAPAWTASFGRDRHGRESVLIAAAEKGLLPVDYVMKMLPNRGEAPAQVLAILKSAIRPKC